jgi:hypothetical protein
MNRILTRIEEFFGQSSALIYQNPWKALALVALFCALFFSQLTKLVIEVSEDSLFHEDDNTYVNYLAFKDQFGRDDVIIVGIKPKAVFDLAFLEKLKRFHQELENKVPFLDEVTSLYNVTSIRGANNELIVENLLENWPGNEAELQQLKNRVMTYPLYKNQIISEDGSFTVMLVEADIFTDDSKSYSEKVRLTAAETNRFADEVRRIAKEYEADDFKIYLAGSPILNQEHVASIGSDVGRMVVLSSLMIFVLLFVVFRRALGVLLPFIVVAVSLLTTLGIMGMMGIPVSPATQAFPPFILAVGIGDSIHVLTIFFRNFQASGNKKEALVQAMKQSGMAILFTSLTTAAGYLSFVQAGLVPISNLGIITPIGVMLALMFTVVLIPALVAILPIKPVGLKRSARVDILLDNLLMATGGFAARNAVKILSVTLVIGVISGIGAYRLKFSQDMMKWFPDKQPVRLNTEMIDRELKSSITLEVIVDTGMTNGLYEPEIMLLLDRMNRFAEGLDDFPVKVAQSTSVVDVLKQIHQALNDNDPAFYAIPESRELIAQELLLFENSGTDDLEKLVDSNFSKARVTIRFPWSDAVDLLPLRERLEKEYQRSFGDTAQIVVTGSVDLSGQAMVGVIKSMANSYLTAGLVIGLMMILLLGSISIGLISLIPNFVPILITLGIMGYFKIPLDLFTILLGGISLGLAVDDTIHFFHHFKRFYRQTNDVEESVRLTMATIGRALAFTTVSIAGGFFLFMAASMTNIANFGFLIGLTLVLAFLADVLIGPALLVVLYGIKTRKAFNPVKREVF